MHFINRITALVIAFSMMMSLGTFHATKAADSLTASGDPAVASKDASSFIDGLGLKAASSNATYSGKYRLYTKNITRKYKIKNLKTSADASGEGYTAVKFTYETTISYKLTKSFVKKVAKTKKSKRTCGNWYYAVIDNNNGLSLETASAEGISVSNDKWKYSSYQKVKSGKYSLKVAKKAATNVTITVRDDMLNDASLIIGLSTIQKNTEADKAFWAGTETFDKTSMYGLYKDYAKAIRIKDLV